MKTNSALSLFVAFLSLSTSLLAGVVEGDAVQITVRGIPSGEQEKVNGVYRVGANGIRLPFLKTRLAVAGMNPDQIGAAAEKAYQTEGVYQTPAIDVEIVRGATVDPETQLSIGGQVRKPGPIPFKKGMTLLQAVQAAGDRTEFGGRNLKLIRNGKTIVLDFRKPEHKNFPMEPNDALIIEQRGTLETDRG